MNMNNFRLKTDDCKKIGVFYALAKEKGLSSDDLTIILSTVEFNRPKPNPIKDMFKSVKGLIARG